MAFVNELVPEVEKSKLTFPVSTRPDGSKPTLWKWTIDRDRDAVLVFTRSEGGGYVYECSQPTMHFVLRWGENLIHISACPLSVSRYEDGLVMTWRILNLEYPPVLDEQQKDVVALVRDAFATLGEHYDGEQFNKVNLEFDILGKYVARQVRFK